MSHDFDFGDLQDTWTLLGLGGFVLALAFAWLRLRSRPGFCVLLVLLAAPGVGLCLLQASGITHPLTRSVQGRPLDLGAYWTRGGGLAAAALTTGPLLLAFLLLRGWERVRRRPSYRPAHAYTPTGW